MHKLIIYIFYRHINTYHTHLALTPSKHTLLHNHIRVHMSISIVMNVKKLIFSKNEGTEIAL